MEQQNIGELIPISESNGKRAVSARVLHAFLGSKQQFQDWIKNRINKYGFIENQDFVSFHKIMKRETGATRVTEYAISVEMAKELSMVENNEKGKIARRYFIRCEQVAKEKAKATNSLSSRVVNARISWAKRVSMFLNLTYFNIIKAQNICRHEVNSLSLQCSNTIRHTYRFIVGIFVFTPLINVLLNTAQGREAEMLTEFSY